LAPVTRNQNGCPNRNYNIKKEQLFITFPVIFLNIVKTVDGRKSILFSFKVFTLLTLGLCRLGQQNHLASPTPFPTMCL
jgi:hypothetical protein